MSERESTVNDSGTQATLAAIERFNEAFGRGDVDAVMRAMTEDCVFENTGPSPDGARYVGQQAVREFWSQWFERNPGARFEAEAIVALGDHCAVRWIYSKVRDGKPWHLRGVDVFRVSHDLVAEKLSYVKG